MLFSNPYHFELIVTFAFVRFPTKHFTSLESRNMSIFCAPNPVLRKTDLLLLIRTIFIFNHYIFIGLHTYLP